MYAYLHYASPYQSPHSILRVIVAMHHPHEFFNFSFKTTGFKYGDCWPES